MAKRVFFVEQRDDKRYNVTEKGVKTPFSRHSNAGPRDRCRKSQGPECHNPRRACPGSRPRPRQMAEDLSWAG